MTPEEALALIERQEAANEASRELLRELNAAGKDLRRTIRVADELAARMIPELINKQIDIEVGKLLREQLLEMGNNIRTHMDASVRKVSREFERLENLFLGKDDGKTPLEDLIRQASSLPNSRRGR